MQLKVQQQALQVRVTEAELQDLLAGRSLRLDVTFSGTTLFGLHVGGDPLRLDFEADVRDSVKIRGPRKGGAGGKWAACA